MKKRISAILLTVCLLLSFPAHAVPDTSENFVRTKVYSGQFSDLPADSVFYHNVSALYEYGLSVGKADGTYGLSDSLTIGQAVIFAARIRSLYRTGSPEKGISSFFSPALPTAVPYLRYLQAEGVLDTSLDFLLDTVATRAQTAHILANILPDDVLPAVHENRITAYHTSGRFIPDVTQNTPYYQDILSLYSNGVCIGSDAIGTYHPDAPISRGAVAAMLTRILDPALRVTPQWDLAAARSAAGTSMADLISPGTYYPAPSTSAEMDESIRYMLASGSNELLLKYPSLSLIQAREVMTAALSAVKYYCEQSYNHVSCSYTPFGTATLTFSASCAPEGIMDYRADTMEAAIAVHDRLWNEGLLSERMSQWEKAWVYYTWICENCAYDDSATDTSLSHIPYSLFKKGLAVCDGYTGAYNLLLKLEGIDCGAYFQNNHIWTVATLDGIEYHIDTTWGDSSDSISYTYFAMTPEQSLLYHK